MVKIKNPVLLSIQPEYVAQILAGTKTEEYRKQKPQADVKFAVIYCTKGDKSKYRSKVSNAPQPGIVAVAEIKEIGPNDDKQSEYKYAYHLSHVRAFNQPIPLSDVFPKIKPQQVAIYLDVEEVQALLDKYPSKVVRKK